MTDFNRSINNHNRLRQFNSYEDGLIIRQSRGEMTVKNLMKELEIGIETLERRASELGVHLYWRKALRQIEHRSEIIEPKPEPELSLDSLDDKVAGNPFRLDERVIEKEQALWRRKHGERRYEELQLRRAVRRVI